MRFCASRAAAIDLLASTEVEVKLAILEEYRLCLSDTEHGGSTLDRVHFDKRLCVLVQQANEFNFAICLNKLHEIVAEAVWWQIADMKYFRWREVG